MVGVQSLSIALSVALVVCTGLLVGSLAITSGRELVQDARRTGDDGVAACLDSGDRDVRLVAGKYLNQVTASVETRMENLFGVGEGILNTAVGMVRAVDPTLMTTRGPQGSAFLDNTVRGYLSSSLRTHLKRGVTQTMWRWGNGTGDLLYFVLDQTQAVAKADGTIPYGVAESHGDPIGTGPGSRMLGENGGRYLTVGLTDAQYRLRDPYTPCWTYVYKKPLPELDTDTFGSCILPRGFFYTPGMSQTEAWMMRNAGTPGGPLAAADKIQVTPVLPFFAWLPVYMSIAYTHPDMPNELGPRQANRVGFFTATISGEAISEVFSSTALPEGSILYCVDRNPWTGAVGQLIATTHGRLTDWTMKQLPGATRLYPFRVPLSVQNHTVNASSSELSVVGEHARHIFAAPTHYEHAANATADSFIEWTDSNDEIYWYTVLHMKYANLNWYISLLVPRSTIMDSIDASVLAIRAANQASRDAGREKEERSFITIIIVTAAVAAILIALSVLMTKMILSPIVALGGDMASVATMHVERVDMDGELSSLSEVKTMQESFRTMVRNLIEYKQYMPQSVLLETEDEDEGSAPASSSNFSLDIKSEAAGSNPSAGSRRHSTLSPKTAAYTKATSAAAGQVARLNDTSLRKRGITVVCYNLRGWLKIVGCLSDHEFQSFYSDVTTALLRCIQVNKGVTDVFAGDHFLVAHNAFTTQATHKASALRAALQVSEAISGIRLPQAAQWPTGLSKLSLSYAACSGEAKVGQMGCAGMKKVTIHSSVTPFAVALERYNKTRGYRGVADHFCVKDAFVQFVLRQTDNVVFTKRLEATPLGDLGVYEVVELKEVDDEEWMYQLERAKAENPYAWWNSIFEQIKEKEWEAARDALEVHCGAAVDASEMDRMRTAVTNEALPSVELM